MSDPIETTDAEPTEGKLDFNEILGLADETIAVGAAIKDIVTTARDGGADGVWTAEEKVALKDSIQAAIDKLQALGDAVLVEALD